jgi:DNA repair exonuclease SbcCD ATPase subunit/DNA repair exonuclease SbcCD nuclease subunit
MKFAHLADTHIRNLKYHKEYRAVFSELYTKLKKEKPDFIIHCGDIAHTKTQISPEFVEMCSNFLSGMADIAPTYVILGNHDGNLKNSSRQDALTPIVEALNHPDLYLLKNSGETELNDKFTINVLSVFDRDNWQNPSSRERINIALYHGSISGVKTDTGWTMEHGEDDINIFNNFDYGFLGDIHKTNQTLDKAGKIRYPGSTVQQNHGETNDKGFLIWNIQDKNTFDCKHIILRNPKPFITIRLTPKGRLPKALKVQKGARLRLISENNLPLDVVRRAVDVAKVRFKPEAITYLNKSAGERGSVEELTNGLIQEDLRDIAVQEEFIQEYLNDYQPDDDTLKRVFDMNRKFNTIVEDEEDVRRNINWKLKKLQWDNLFNYGESNSIDFSKIEGIVGVLGKNFSGKSSIIDSLLYTVYNTTSKNNRRNFNLINQNEDWCRGYVEIDIGTKTYKIERKSKKYVKKLKGKETDEAKTDVEFNVYDNAVDVETSLNGITRMETDKNIRKIFGTIEDFLTTSMASQLESLSYINEGSTRRKEILAKFLDLEIFEKKFRLSKEATSDLKGAIRKMSDRNFNDEITESNTELARIQTKLLNRQRLSEEKSLELLEQRSLLSNLEAQINSIPEEVIDIKQVLKNLKDIKKQAAIIEVNLNKKKERMINEREVLQKIENFVDGFDIEDVNGKKQVAAEFVQRLQQIEDDISEYESTKEVIKKKIELLKDAPCSHKLQNQCHFVSDARHAIDDSSRVKIGLNQLTLNRTTISGKLDKMNIHKLDEYSNKYYLLQEKNISKRDEVSKLKIDIERDKMKLFKANNLLENLEEKEQLYEQNKEAIENFEQLSLQKQQVVDNILLLEEECEIQKTELINLYTAVGRSEQKNTELTNQRDEFVDMQEEFTTADLYMRCMHANGISYDIIKKRLPLINDEISKILTTIVEFEVFFENDDKKLDILIKHPSHDARPIEMGSGAEKTIAAMAIRLALLNVSTLPKGDVFILDEPGTALDAENMEGFIRILDMIKTQFKTVLLISHLDSLKDIVDRQIMIEKIDGRAFVSE